ncbi:MAG: trypsin-like peptidase domain-containing protein [Acidimicrobiales bacterium]
MSTDDDERPADPWRFRASSSPTADEGEDTNPWKRPSRPPRRPTSAGGTSESSYTLPVPPVSGSAAPTPSGFTWPPPSASGQPTYGDAGGSPGGGPTYPSGGPTYPSGGGPTYPSASYPSGGGPTYPSATYPSASYPSGGPTYPGAPPSSDAPPLSGRAYPPGTTYRGAPPAPGSNAPYSGPSPYRPAPGYPPSTYPGATYPGAPAPAPPGYPPPTYPGATYPGAPVPAPPGYPPPTYPGGGPAAWGWGPPREPGAPPYGTWSPPPPRSRKSVLGIIVLVAVLVAAVVGLAIGGAIEAQHKLANNLGPNNTVAQGAGGLPASQAEAIAQGVDHSVVDINARLGYAQAAAAGTGMVLSSNGEILTNNHVVAGETSLSVTVVGGKTYTARVLGTDPTMDVALLMLDNASGLTPISVGDDSRLTSGQPIVAVGNAGGVGGTPSVVTGTVAALGQSVTASDLGGGNAENLTDMIEINAPLQPGDSGGPLVTTAAQVVGMDTAAATSGELQTPTSVGFAIPISRAESIAQQIAAGKGSSTVLLGVPGFLGVQIAPDNPGSVAGAPISGVLPNSPADKAGLTTGDVINAVDGKPIASATALTTVLQQHHSGDKVVIGWVDSSGSNHNAAITLIAGPAA